MRVAVVKKLHLGCNIIDAVKHIVGFASFVVVIPRPRRKEFIGNRPSEQLVPAVELDPWCDLLQSLANAMHLWRSDVSERRESVAVQGRQCDLIEID